MSKMVFLYVTHETEQEAKNMAKELLEKRIIGCVNIYPVNAMYWWEGKIADEAEFVMIAKTTQENSIKAKQEIERLHPFDTPCISQLDVDPNLAYYEWIKNEIED